MTMRAKKKSRSRVLIKVKDQQAEGFYDALAGIPPKSDTQKYMAGYRDGEKTRQSLKPVKL